MGFNEYQSLMNNTKWEEILLTMYNYPLVVRWRTKDIETGYICEWGCDWYYHFKHGGYKTIEWLEIKTDNKKLENDVLELLRKIHVVGKVLDNSIKVYGYLKTGISVGYL